MRQSNDEPMEFSFVFHHETDHAILVSSDGDKDKGIWLPLSQTDIIKGNTNKIGGAIVVEIPMWLAEKKGLM